MSAARRRHALAAALLGALGLWWLAADAYGHELIARIAALAVLAMAVDLAAGYGGMVSLGHGALAGAGAYAYALAATALGWPSGLALLAGVGAAGLAALAAGWVAGRAEGVFFLAITLALGQIGHEAVFGARALGGDDGMFAPRPDLAALGLDPFDPATFSAVALILLGLVYAALAGLVASPFGLSLRALGEHPARAEALGFSVRARRAVGFGVSGAVAGLAGVMIAAQDLFLTPKLLHWTTSGEALVMAILGGLGTLVGPIYGAVFVVLAHDLLSDLTDYWGAALGAILLLAVLFLRQGVIGWLLERMGGRP